MSLSTLPLSYCTNVHPGRTLAEVEGGLDRFTLPIRDAYAHPLAAGLWLARPVVDELLRAPEGLKRFADGLARRGLTCHTLNAFPYGDFHSDRVKDDVYRPDWSTADRLEYTLGAARVLAALLPEGVDGSVSTLPVAFKAHPHAPDFAERCEGNLIAAANALKQLREETGLTIRLAVEPEPLCDLETTDEAIAFFRRLWVAADRAGAAGAVREYVGLCYDVCHQAVEFEDVAASIRAIDAQGIRINKVHLSCALRLDRPADNLEGREALRRYVEPRYLHQTTARRPDGSLARYTDLSADFIDRPPAEFAAAPEWRIHFHVPVDAEGLGPLGTTRADLRNALAAVGALSYAPHLEVETYTWEVFPDGRRADLVPGFARELLATQALITTVTSR